jgi:transcriptional pleiotropic regulator of transition state genes
MIYLIQQGRVFAPNINAAINIIRNLHGNGELSIREVNIRPQINQGLIWYEFYIELKEANKMLKATGIVRKVDELGRVVIPIELRRTLDINIKDPLEIFTDGDRIILRKYEPACVFCGNASNVVKFMGKNVCRECLESMREVEG